MRVLFLLLLAHSVLAQKWCGKVYKPGLHVDPPGGQFPIPATTTTPQLSLRCNAAITPYLPDDLADSSSAQIIVDALVRHQEIAGAQPLTLPSSPDTQLSVTVRIDGKLAASGNVPLNGSVVLPFDLSALTPRTRRYHLTCTGTLSSPQQTFTSYTSYLNYIPSPPEYIGSITKIDQRTGGILTKRANTQDPYTPIFPVGYFSQFGYLVGNDKALEDLKSQGINVLNVVPPETDFTDMPGFSHMLDKMEELGLWLMLDMRWNYANTTFVAKQITAVRNRKNVLVYYTDDEADGAENRRSAPETADLFISGFEPYRPSAECLNCQDFWFSYYAAGTPILMPDVYPIGINATYSSVYNTPCSIDQGCCGCDNCVGDFEDVRHRIHEYWMRIEANGWSRTKTIWDIPQAMGGSTNTDHNFWSRTPSYTEYLVLSIVAINAGSKGLVAWEYPTTMDITLAQSGIAKALPDIQPFLLSSPISPTPVHFAHVVTGNRLDIGLWFYNDGKALVLAANLNYFPVSITLDEVLAQTKFPSLSLSNARLSMSNARLVLDGGARIEGSVVTFQSVNSGGWVFG